MLLLYFTISWCCGLLFSEIISLPEWNWAILAGLSFLSLAATRGSSFSGRIFILLLLFEAGGFYGSLRGPDTALASIQSYTDIGQPLSIHGKIISPPETIDRTSRFILEADEVCTGRHGDCDNTSGKIQVYSPLQMNIQYGDSVRVYGILETPPVYEGFSYREYLARKNIFSLTYSTEIDLLYRGRHHILRQQIFRFRRHAHQTLSSLFTDPEAALLSGILLGIEGGISTDLMKDFQATGTAHIIAISGFNITLIASIFISLLRRWLGMRSGLILAALAIGLYTVFVGADAAVLRAALMVAVSLSARLIGRQNHAYSALAAAVFIMTLFDRSILHDAGFQLSAAATLGLLMYGPMLENWCRNNLEKLYPDADTSRAASWINDFILLTFAAQLTTLPLMITYFHQIPLVSLIVNPLILPAQPAVMILGGLAVLTGMLYQPAGQLLAWTAWPFLRMTTSTVSFFASSKFGNLILIGNHSLLILLYFIIMGALTLAAANSSLSSFLFKIRAIPIGLGLSALAIACSLTWSAVEDRPDGYLHIDLLPTSGSEVLLIRSPGGRLVLVGCGASPVNLSEAIGRRVSPLTAEIDWLLLGSTDQDTVQGFSGIVEQYNIKQVLITPTRSTAAYQAAGELMRSHEIPFHLMQTGNSLDLHDGVTLEIIGTGSKGTAYMLRFNHFRLFHSVGCDADLIQSITHNQEIRHITAAVLPDGGSIAMNPPDFLETINPTIVLLSIPPGESSGRPHEHVIEILQNRTCLRTDHHGWIHIMTDGKTTVLETEYNP